MSVTIDSLDIQIRSSAGSAAANIEKLATSLGSLQKNAKLTTVSNQLTRLSDALGKLQVSSSTVGTIKGLAGAMKSLSGIQKSSGLNSAINSLKKLPEVVNALDPATISAFSTAMRELSDGLSPLAKKIDTISKGFSKLPSQVSKCVTAVKRLDKANDSAATSTKKHSSALDKQSFNLLATYEHLSNVFSMMHGIQDGVSKLLNDAIQWDGIQFRFGRAFGEDAEMVLEYADKVSKELRINKQEFMQYSSLYGSLLKGFGVEQEQVTTISIGLAELSYDIWAAHNDRYRTLEDASEAVRSAITGELEPIRNAGIAMSEASMQDYLDSIGMAHVSMEKLTEAQKSEVRYAVMVNGAMQQGIIGTYAREMNTAEGSVRTLTQQLKTLGQALGSLFIPILQKTLPWVSAFVELITDGLIALGAMFGIKFQEIKWGDPSSMAQTAKGADATANALGDAAKNAKAMKDYTMGFDELNIIDPSSASGSGGAAGGVAGAGGDSLGLDLDTLWDDAVFKSASKQIDELKAKIKEYANEHKLMLGVVSTVTGFLTLMKVLRGLNSLLGITKTVDNVKKAFEGISKASSGLKTAADAVKMYVNAVKTMAPQVGWLNALFPKAAMILSSASAWVTGTLVPAMGNALTKIPSLLAAAVRLLPWAAVITAIVGAIALAIVDKDFTNIGYKIGHALGSALKKVGELLGTVGDWIASVGESILGGINAAWEWVKEEFDIRNVVDLIVLMFNPVSWVTLIIPKMIEIGAEVLPGLWKGIKSGWNNFWENIGEFINGFVKGFKDTLGIKSPSTVFAEIGDNIIAGLLGGITERWESVKAWFTETILPVLTTEYWMSKFEGVKLGITAKLAEVKQAISGKWAEIKKWFTSNVSPKFTLSFWLDKFKNLKEGLVQTIKNALNAGIDMMNKFIGWLNEKLKFSWDGLNIMGKQIYPGGSVQLFTIPKISGRFAEGGFPDMGQMFIAREAGPELVGSINGRTAVANNDQIVAAVSQGVYEAVVMAMGANRSSGNQSVNVYLDGKQIYASVKKRDSERGMQLIGDQLGYAY